MRTRCLWMSVVLVVGLASVGWSAPQDAAAPAGASAQGNHLVTFTGVLKNADGQPRPGAATLTLTLYTAQEGGDALWQERQVVQADAAGRYTLLLGSASAAGLPTGVLGDGKGQWLAAQVEGEAELPRVLLVAVPYALKAADADTLGGKPLASFVLTENLTKSIDAQAGTNASGLFAAATGGGFEPALAHETDQNTWFGLNAGAASPTGSSNAFFGASAGQATTTGCCNTFIGRIAGLSNTTGESNVFVGNDAGQANVSASDNTFIGRLAGTANTAAQNTFVGSNSGLANTDGVENTFVGFQAGMANTNMAGSTLVGFQAGKATNGGYSTMVGSYAGTATTTGGFNTFIGRRAGEVNTTGSVNTFVGMYAGRQNTTGYDNLFVGYWTGVSNTVENHNTLIGNYANSSAGVNSATAVGFRSMVSQSNALVLGAIDGLNGATASTNVGIGTATPVARLHIGGGEVRVANGASSWSSHLNYLNLGTNYIRGVTYFDTSTAYFSGGTVGIGTTTPAVHVAGELRMQNGSGAHSHFNYLNLSENYIRGVTYFDSAAVYFTGGNVGIGTTSPAYPLDLASGAHVTAGGVWTNASSRALKQDIADLPLAKALAAIDALAPVTYTYKASPDERHVGFIAEDVPDLVATPDRKSLSPMDIVAVLTKVVQDQQATLQAQQKTNRELQARLARLEAQAAAGASSGAK